MSQPTSQTSGHVGGTPAKYRHSSNTCISSQPPEQPGTVTQRDMAQDLFGETLGGMPVETFLDEFLPGPGIPATAKKPEFQKLVCTSQTTASKYGAKHVKTEDLMYDPFIAMVKNSGLLGKDDSGDDLFHLVNTSAAPDPNSREGRKWKPDVTLRPGKAPGDLKRIANFDEEDLLWEFKSCRSTRPYNDPTPSENLQGHAFQTEGPTAEGYRGQIAAQLTELCQRQHRTHAFMVHLSDPYVRFIRTDRAGLVVSQEFNFRENPDLLSKFIWRYCQLSAEHRGHDPTVSVPTEDEDKLARKKLADWKPKHSRKVVAIQVPVADGNLRRVLAWGSLRDAESLTGRATRAYPVWDLQSKSVLFLKDVWRAEGLEKEADVLKELNEAGVPHIPKVLCGGDVIGDFQTTLTQSYITRDWRCGHVAEHLSKRIHHRILEDFVPYTLDICNNAKEMMTLIHHAFLAHRGAYKLWILHRDLSHYNVLVRKHKDGTLEGVLIDWDLCLRLKDKNGVPITLTGPRQRFRTGTWYFMSVEILSEPGKAHLLRDDLESFLYLVLYLSLIWFVPTDLKLNDVDFFVKKVFQQVEKARDGGYVGGSNKLAMLREYAFTGSLYSFKDNKALTLWLKTAHVLFFEYFTGKQQLASLQDTHNMLQTLDQPLPDDARLKEAETRLGQSTALLDDHKSIQQLFEKALSSPDGEWSPLKANVLMGPKRDRDEESEPEPPFRSQSISESIVTTSANSDGRPPTKRARKRKVEKES